jgi:hypothetical protein
MYKKIYGITLLLVLSMTTSCNAKDKSKETSMYQSVHAKELLSKSTLKIHQYNRGDSPEFVIDGNVLYLKIQTSYNKGNIYMVADTQTWDNSKLEKLIETSPEIKKLLPDPNSKNKGILWLH